MIEKYTGLDILNHFQSEKKNLECHLGQDLAKALPILLLHFCDKFIFGFRSRLAAWTWFGVFGIGNIFRISVKVAGHSDN